MKRSFLISVLIICVIALFSCKSKNDAKQTVTLPEGYSTQAISGGRLTADINIKALSVERSESVTQLNIAFARGSEYSESGETNNDSLPKYTVEKQASPYGITVALQGVEYIDYARTFKLPENGDLVGVFFDDIEGKLHFQFSKDVAFKVSENLSELTVSVVPLAKQRSGDEFAYYVTSNTYEYYSGGILKFDNMHLTKTRSGEIIFISDEISSTEQAGKLLSEMKTKYPLYAGSFEVIAKYYDALPIYNQSLDNSRVYSEPIMRIDGKASVGEVFLADGFYLTEFEGGKLYERFIHDTEGAHSEIYIEKDKARECFIDFEFESIEKCISSPDDKMLAVLENSGTGSHLYIFDLISAELLYDLSDVGFGKRISDFIWNDLGTAIYAIGGTNEIKLRMYDFNITDEANRTSVIYDGNLDEGKLTLYDGDIYFVSSSMDGSKICKLKPELGITEEFCSGSMIQFNGDYAAVSTAATIVEQSGFEFFITNVKTGERKTITSDFDVFDYVWSDSGRYIYYIENRLSGNDAVTESDTAQNKAYNDEYPYTLYRYDVNDGKSDKLCDLKYYNRIESHGDNVLIMDYDDTTGRILIAGTYIIQS